MGGGGDLGDLLGVDGADVAHAAGVGADEQEEVAGTGEFIGHAEQAVIHLVEAVLPEFAEECLGALVRAFQLKAAADGVLGGELDDAPGEGVVAPGVQALLEDLLAGVGGAVAVGGAEGGGPDEEGVLRLGDGEEEAEPGFERVEQVGHGRANSSFGL